MQRLNHSDLIGIPFVDGGRTLEGLDCWGCVMLAAQTFGVDVPDFKVSPFAHAMINEEVATNLNKLVMRIDDPGPGDGVAMATSPHFPGAIQHFGIMVDHRRFIHCVEQAGVIITRLDDHYYSRRIKGFYRWL